MGKSILFVDDEASILKSLERLFFDTDYDVFTASGGEAGLKLLASTPIDVVVSDMRMPEMNGNQFLRKVKDLYPGTTRLILSGYANEAEIFDSLINGASAVYLFKPWDGDDIKKRIDQIFEIRQIFSDRVLLDVVNGLENLSLVTGIYHVICRLIEEDADISEMAKVIESDPAVTASLLRIVNSAFYNVKTGSVVQALTFLGLPTVKMVVLSCSLLKWAHINIPPFNTGNLTRHAALSNLFLQKIYIELLKKPLPETLHVAGILHNFGLILCLHYFPRQYEKVMQNAVKEEPWALEKAMLGVTHDELGGYILNWWGLPYPIVECALFHHRPLHEAVINQEAVAAIHIASHYAWKEVLVGWTGILEPAAAARLNILPQEMEHFFSQS